MYISTDSLPYKAYEKGLVSLSDILFLNNITLNNYKSLTLKERKERKAILSKINSL